MDDSIGTHPHEKELYYYVGDRRVRLFPHPRVFAVRLEQAARLKLETLSTEARHLLEEAQPVTFLPRDGLNVYRAKSGLKVVEVLRKEAGLAIVSPAFRRAPEGKDIVFVTSRLLAQFRPDLTAEKIAAALKRLSLRILEPLPYASPNGFLLEAAAGSDGLGALAAANTLVEEGLVVFAEPDLIQSRHWRDSPVLDPTVAAFLAQQWHLEAVGVIVAWKQTRGSPSIRIAVLDDGVDLLHPEFSAPVASGQSKVAAQFDFATGIADASPKTYVDSHGTACAGVAAASGAKAAGAAPGCRLIVARTPDYLGVSDEARMFEWAADSGADVISVSWGPLDGTGETFPLPSPTRLAIRYCLNNGRVGKGIPIFWAAGNGSESVSADEYASNPDVMAIAACTAAEAPAPYSDYGPEIFACAPSNGGVGEPAIFTTDRSGADGYNPGSAIRGDAQGDYTNSFGGTSAAAPLAAGIAALVLSINPTLTAAQVRDLLHNTADRIGDATAYDGTGHSNKLGYGRLNAAKAVEAARQAAPAEPGGPTILGPNSWSRTNGPPMFQVDPSPHPYYVVEVAIQPELFDSTNHGSERTEDSFYGSWSDSPFESSPTYTLQEAAWVRLRAADRLWYRVGSSASPTTYVDYTVSTADDQGNLARSISIVSGVGESPPSLGIARRTISDIARDGTAGSDFWWIEGPLHWNRGLGPPTFRLRLDPGAACKVEVADDLNRLESANGSGGRPKKAFFTSNWIGREDETGAPQARIQGYTLPLAAWEKLLGAQRLYYRLVISGGEIVAGPVFVMDLTGEAIPPKEGVGPMRTEETLWRMPRTNRKVMRRRSTRGS